MDTTALIMGVLFGSVGMGYMVYGKKQQKGVALLSGVALCGIPYFIPKIFLLIMVGIALMALPFFVRE